eukprot:c10131_g1_i2.p1 GENE.c10131_g1_i2~~c10131_g1_i2.p1  ORF type:complete len:397 (-),score=112.16 c10131_g1_i2:336-1526(-)
MIGGTFGVFAGLLSALAVQKNQFWLLLVGAGFLGVFGSFSVFTRYAAAEVSSPHIKSRAVSWVVFGGASLSLIGPGAAIVAHKYPVYYLAAAGMASLVIVLASTLRFPRLPLLVASIAPPQTIISNTAGLKEAKAPVIITTHERTNSTSYGGTDQTSDDGTVFQSEPDIADSALLGGGTHENSSTMPDELSVHPKSRPLKEILLTPTFGLAVASQACAVWCMGIIMTSTTVSMDHHGFRLMLSAATISIHLIGMFVPGFFTGHVIDRIGCVPVIVAGLLSLLSSVIVLRLGYELAHYFCGLFLLGTGWNFSYIAGTRLLLSIELHTPKEQSGVQAANETIVQFSAACGALLSGVLFDQFGWHVMCEVVGGVAAVLVTCVLLVAAFSKSCRMEKAHV